MRGRRSPAQAAAPSGWARGLQVACGVYLLLSVGLVDLDGGGRAEVQRVQCERFAAAMDLTEPLTAQLVTNFTTERIELAKDARSHGASAHFSRRISYSQDCYDAGIYAPKHLTTDNNPVDFFGKLDVDSNGSVSYDEFAKVALVPNPRGGSAIFPKPITTTSKGMYKEAHDKTFVEAERMRLQRLESKTTANYEDLLRALNGS